MFSFLVHSKFNREGFIIMMKFIWSGMIIIGVIVGAVNGKMEEITNTITTSAKEAAALCLGLIGVYTLWLGLLNVAQEAGLIDSLAKRLRRVISALFTGIRRESAAIGYITLNFVANMMGMGNAATPFGLKAIAALQEENPDKSRASHAMCMFVIINTCSVQLLPMTIIAVRAAAGSSNPAEIVPTAFLATLATAIIGALGAKICAARSK